jgi:hypothetical protein
MLQALPPVQNSMHERLLVINSSLTDALLSTAWGEPQHRRAIAPVAMMTYIVNVQQTVVVLSKLRRPVLLLLLSA